ncbi:hypothetical protein LNTAR_21620 [Lentisphaera araneosa HTCC2155]|uniref:Uncharacterized protein n=1 Tax=Lentisphaera araneosa HTCC2155 TaxID=313628 RepID=A6DM58_9BACT|nr:hypothetical protein LNTAR_21620 [Lentisphaera araneosa HTCC2155]
MLGFGVLGRFFEKGVIFGLGFLGDMWMMLGLMFLVEFVVVVELGKAGSASQMPWA